jgi:plastocyanin
MSAQRPAPRVLAGLAVILALAVAGCGSSTSAGDAGGSSGGGNSVSISVSTYKPATITVAPGTTVTWTNDDPVVHTVTADDGSWDSGNLSQSQTFTKTFETAGTYTYHCTVHPWMVGTVIVTAMARLKEIGLAASSAE